MGYFSNGTEGDIYQEQVCSRCVNNGDERDPDMGCAVMDLHLIHNYEQFKQPIVKTMLDELIPRDGMFNGQCRMFRAKPV